MAETYQKGEYIRYACNGVCLVDDVRLDRLTKKEPPKEFYILKPVSNPASTLFVPTGNATLVAKMSRLPDREELDALILATREEPLDWIDDRKIRLASFQTIVKECDLGQLISLVSCIYHRREDLIAAGKKLGASEETLLQRAEALIENEVAFVLKVEQSEVSDYIRDKLAEAITARQNGFGLDAAAVCLTDALQALFDLTGENASDATIEEVFETFCVGK